MPRRTYDYRNGRRRVTGNQGKALESLVAEMARQPPPKHAGKPQPTTERNPA